MTNDATTITSPDPLLRTRRVTVSLIALSFAIAVMNFGVFLAFANGENGEVFLAFLGLALLQGIVGLIGAIAGIVYWVRLVRADRKMLPGVVATFLGVLATAGGVFALFMGALGLALAGAGGAWGRPLRIRGRVRHPELRRGEDWTRGDRPDASALDADTRAALEALWLHDAQKEHASVPAFSRVAWMLTAVGAPAELLERTFHAAQEELEHTRLCFALAAGYGGRSHSVEAMPELLLDGALEVRGNALVHLAVESVKDGCLLEDYNADVAAACAEGCEEPATRAVLERIAIEERSHAELSWSIVAFCIARGGDVVIDAVRRAGEELAVYARPTAVAGEKLALVRRANDAHMRAHGRLPDETWAAIYAQRLTTTLARLDGMLTQGTREATAREAA